MQFRFGCLIAFGNSKMSWLHSQRFTSTFKPLHFLESSCPRNEYIKKKQFLKRTTKPTTRPHQNGARKRGRTLHHDHPHPAQLSGVVIRLRFAFSLLPLSPLSYRCACWWARGKMEKHFFPHNSVPSKKASRQQLQSASNGLSRSFPSRCVSFFWYTNLAGLAAHLLWLWWLVRLGRVKVPN